MAEHCNHTECDRPVRSRGLCITHYNQTQANRHRKVMRPCDCCGKLCAKEARGRRYSGVYCSELCRDYSRWGALSKPIPAKHWARWYGATSPWTPPERGPAFQCGTCDDCGCLIVEPTGQTASAYCSRSCARRVSKRRRRAREHNAPGQFTLTQVVRQYHRQGGVCAYCHTPCSGLPDPEHVLPLSRGGRNDMTNVVASCRPCNADKNDLTLDEWQADRARRGKPPVDTTLSGPAYYHLTLNAPTRAAYRHTLAA